MRPSDMALLKKIKEEEMAKKKLKEKQEVIVNAPLDFEIWWKSIAETLKLKPHMKEIVWADFKSRGLKRYATLEAFNSAMRLFGYEV